MSLFREEQLANGLSLSFTDRSNRYFGDYHRVCLMVSAGVEVASVIPSDDPLAEDVRQFLPAEISFERTLEKMGVAGADVEQTKEQMATDFLKASVDYLSRSTFPRQLVERELARRKACRSFY